MTDDRANIKVSREFYETHNSERERLGVSWEEYIEGNAPEWVESLRESIESVDTGGVSFDDVKVACAVALEETLTEEVRQR